MKKLQNFFARLTLRSRVFGWMLVISLVPLVAIYVTYQMFESVLTQRMLTHLEAISDAHANQIETFADRKIQEITAFTLNPHYAAVIEKYVNAFALQGINGTEYQAVDLEYRPLLAGQKEMGGYSDLLLLDLNGNVIFTTVGAEIAGANLRSSPHKQTPLANVFERTLILLKSEISEFDKFPPGNKPAIFIAAPVFHHGALIGVIAFQFNNKEIYALVNDYTGLGNTGETIIAVRNADEIVFVAPTRHASDAAFKIRYTAGTKKYLATYRALTEKRGAEIARDYRDVAVVTAWQYLPSFRWGMVTKVDVSEVMAPLTAMQRFGIFAGIVTLLTLTVVSLLLTRSVISPALAMVEGTKRLRQHDFNARVPESGPREFVILGQALNRMAAELANFYKNLEEQVAERTRALTTEITESRLKEAEISRQHSLLSAIMDGTDDAIFSKDSEGRYQIINAAGARLLGHPIATVIGRTDAELIDPATAKVFKATDTEVMASGKSMVREETGQIANTIYTFMTHKTPWRDTTGKIIGIIGVSRDITEHKKVTAKVHEQARLLDLIFTHSLDCIVLLDKDYNFIKVSDSYAKVCGRSVAEFSGHNHFELYPSPLKDEFDLAIQQRQVYSRKSRPFVFPDHPEWGVTYWDLGMAAIQGANNEIELIVFTLKDVTNYKHAEEALRLTSNRLMLATRAANVGIWDWDIANNEIIWNDEMYRLYGIDSIATTITYDIWENSLHPEDRERVDNEVQAALRGEREFDMEFRLLWPDETVHHIQANAVVLRDAAGNPIRMIGTNLDLTKRINTELIAKRAQRMEAIGTLAGGLAHDLNNALSPIMMGVEYLHVENSDEIEVLESMKASIRRAADMVRQLLTYARGLEGQRVLIQPFHFAKEMEKNIRGTFPRNIQFKLRLEPNLPGILGDPALLNQVVMNLCVNAREAMPHGGSLIVEMETLDVNSSFLSRAHVTAAKPGQYLVIRVIDTGVGIPPQIIDRIFDPFFTTKQLEKSTGLGLSTVQGIVKGHGGFIQVLSRVSNGSAFTVYLPIEKVLPVEEPVTKSYADYSGNKETVLFVDDNAEVRYVAGAVLTQLNFTPVLAIDGINALEQVSKYRDDLRVIITDLNMPQMDGLSFVSALRKQMPDIPVVVASGRLEEHHKQEFKAMGVHLTLDKPFTLQQIADVLYRALHRTTAPAEPTKII